MGDHNQPASQPATHTFPVVGVAFPIAMTKHGVPVEQPRRRRLRFALVTAVVLLRFWAQCALAAVFMRLTVAEVKAYTYI